MSAADDSFTWVTGAFVDRPGVTMPGPGGGFGSRTLRVGGRIFAMQRPDAIVLKLPAAEVARLIAEGRGRPFENGSGTAMREWVAMTPDEPDLLGLAEQAYGFVASR